MILNLTANPNPTYPYQTSKLTASITYDNKGNYHDPKDGHIPDGITVEFPNNEISKLIDGTAQSTFKSSLLGLNNILIRLDNQELSIGIETRDFPQLNDVYVNKSGDNSNSGDKDHPMSTINAALDRLIDGGTIHLLTDLDINEPIYINKSVTINNSKPGNILDNENGTLACLNGLGKHQIIGIEDSNVHLNGLYFQNGNATAGGAITSLNSNLTIHKSKFDNNSALIGGAILSLEKNKPNNNREIGFLNNNNPIFPKNNFLDSQIHTNEDLTRSFNAKNTLTINSSTFIYNKALLSSSVISANNQNIYVNDTFFYNNTFNENTTAISFTTNNLNFDETNLITEDLYTDSNKISPYMEINRIDKDGKITNITLLSYYKPNQTDINNYQKYSYFTAKYNINGSDPIRLYWTNNVTLGDVLIFHQEIKSSNSQIEALTSNIIESDKRDKDDPSDKLSWVTGIPINSIGSVLIVGLTVVAWAVLAGAPPIAQQVNVLMPINNNVVNQPLINQGGGAGANAAGAGGAGANAAAAGEGAGGGGGAGEGLKYFLAGVGSASGVGLLGTGAAFFIRWLTKDGEIKTKVDSVYIANDDDEIIKDKSAYVGETIPICLDVRFLHEDANGSDRIPDGIWEVKVFQDSYNYKTYDVNFTDSVGTFDCTIECTSRNVKIVFMDQEYKTENNTKYMFSNCERSIDVEWNRNPTKTIITAPEMVTSGEEFKIKVNTTDGHGNPIKNGNYNLTLYATLSQSLDNIEFKDGVAEIPCTLYGSTWVDLGVVFNPTPIYGFSSNFTTVHVVVPAKKKIWFGECGVLHWIQSSLVI